MPNCKKCESQQVIKNGFVPSQSSFTLLEKPLTILLLNSLMQLPALFKDGLKVNRRECLNLIFLKPSAKQSLMKCGILQVKKNKCWLLKAVSRPTGRTIAWVIGGRDVATFRRLYEKVTHLETCGFYTDEWQSFAKVLPESRHKISRSGTVLIEQDNSNTRHHLERFTRRTKIV